MLGNFSRLDPSCDLAGVAGGSAFTLALALALALASALALALALGAFMTFIGDFMAKNNLGAISRKSKSLNQW